MKKTSSSKNLKDYLKDYLKGQNYDASFAKELRKIRPNLFVSGNNPDKPSGSGVLVKPIKRRKEMKKFTLNEVVDRLMNANSPALKAHATRALKTYAVLRALEIGSTPTAVIAGVRAAVTKRKQKA